MSTKPEEICQFVWIRHGQTAQNCAGIVQGHLDTDLDATGRQQAQCAAERLKNEKFDHIFCSPLHRAYQTAEIIAQFHPQTVEPLAGLREWDLGDLCGRRKAELQQNYPDVLTAFQQEITEVRPPHGESHLEFYARVAQCLEDLAQNHLGEKLLLVTHGGTLRAIFHHLCGEMPPYSYLPKTSNAGYGNFTYQHGFWQLGCWNDTSHLQGVGVLPSVIF